MADQDREKALETALANIEKQFGKGAMMRLGDDVAQEVPAIPTGALTLDVALGVGGLPRGRVVELYGPEASGKCLTADTYVWTDHGLETVAELFERCGQAASCTSRVTEISEQGVRAVNERGELEAIAALTHNYRRPVRRVTVTSGRQVKVTHNHPLRVLNERGRIVWRKAGQLKPGDVLVSAAFGAAESPGGGGDLSEDEAVLLGYLVAEGSLTNDTAVRFTNWDREVGDEFTAIVEGLFGCEVHCYDGREYAVHSRALRQRLADEFGLDYVPAAGKTVPHRVRTAGHKLQRAFLSALFEGDGCDRPPMESHGGLIAGIDESSTVGLGTASEGLAREVQLMLYGLGVPATVSSHFNREYERDYWRVTINPACAHRFLEEVGFRSKRRAGQVDDNFRRSSRDPQLENVPHLRDLVRDLRDNVGGDRALDELVQDLLREDMDLNCSRQRLQGIVDWAETRIDQLSSSGRAILSYLRRLADHRLTFEEVTEIEEAGEQPTFDLVLPETHSFVTNGLISHNTTVALHILAEAQKQGGIAAFIDAEHALDPTYAKAIGLDTDELLVSQPDTGEQALEIMDMLIRSGAVDVIAVDSVAALTPKAEIEGEMGDSHVGLQARLMSQAMRKLAGSLKKSSTCALFINQIREKIGVMFGCMSWETEVTLADGTKEHIGKIVNQELPVEVLSYDFESGEIVPRKVIGWFDNGSTDRFLFVQVACSGPTGRPQTSFRSTPNHQIMTPSGWVEARELEVGDRVIRSVPHYLSDFQHEIVLGGLMGDGSLSASSNGLAARYRFGHGSAQREYAGWKASLFENVTVSTSTNEKDAVFVDVQPLAELAELREAVYSPSGKVLDHEYLKALTPLALAIWYQDDGTFQIRSQGKQTRSGRVTGRAEICVEALEKSSRERLRDYLADAWDLEARLTNKGENAFLIFPSAETEKLHRLLAPYVHPSMEYKLLPHHRGNFEVTPELGEVRYEPMPLPVVNIEDGGPLMESRNHRYDIEIEGSHNYFVNGVMVHNSPETTPGGRALKFYSSVRLDIRRIETLKDGKDAVGNRCRVKVVKNKCVAAGTRVFDPETGLTHTIEEIVDDGEGASVWATDKRGRLEVRPIGARLNQGEQEVIDLVLRDGTELSVTPDHKILTEHGWQQAGELAVGDRVARPRRAGSFGDREPVPPHHARMLGYLIGDGYVGGKTPVAFINTEEVLHDDAAEIADELGCRTRYTHDGMHAHFSHRIGETNELLELTRWAGIYGHLAPEKRIPAELLREGVSREVLGNLVFGIWESDGWISREQTGGIRVGFATTSKQLAWQLHWALLRFGIVSTVKMHEPGSRRSLIEGRRIEGKVPCWQVRVSGIDNVHRFAASVPTWGPKGQRLEEVLDDPELAKHRGSRAVYLPASVTEPIRNYLADLGVRAKEAAGMIGPCAGDPRGGMKQVLGSTRIRRDRLAALANALDSEFLWNILAEEVYYERIHAISEPRVEKTYDIEVEELHNFVADGVVVHNCAPPFRQAEFDIVYGEGISKEGTLLDLGVEEGLIRKAGAWYSYDDEQLGQGRENAREFLREHEDIALDLEKRVKDELGIAPLAAEGEDAEADGEDTDGGEED